MPVITNPIFSESTEGLSEVLSTQGYQLLLGQTRYDRAREADLVETFLGRKVDGLVMTGRVEDGPLRTRLRRTGVPLVETWDIGPRPLDLMVGFSNEDAAAAAVQHLLARGYRSVGFIGGTDLRSEMRLAGCRRALREAGAEAPHAIRLSSPTTSSLDAGAAALDALRQAQPGLRAVFCSNDMIAAGVLFEAQRQGIAVPGTLAIMGFSDLPIARATVPALSTVRVRAHEIGAAAARLLLDRIAQRPISDALLDLGYSLIARAST
ncbi:substrate-binding domain-containing protein [Leptolyngbya sp. 15MV]|nr:substrate-binding domain-containing protein [Leptolyngbya sp. 15MV]